ncbi:MAG: hypothetical protein J4F50_07470 [Acidimicrobiia bacterium]|nr:hypothetical protein [Acidimicrobiia bacterium]
MAGPEVLSVQGESPATAADPTAAVAGSSAASQRWPQLIPIAQLVAVVLGVFAIIWNQQQTTDNLRKELSAEITRVETGLRAEFSNEIGGLRTEFSNEIGGLRTEFSNEIGGLRAAVAENGQRLARIEGFLGIGIPDAAPE